MQAEQPRIPGQQLLSLRNTVAVIGHCTYAKLKSSNVPSRIAAVVISLGLPRDHYLCVNRSQL